jgi:hypothetical protein
MKHSLSCEPAGLDHCIEVMGMEYRRGNSSSELSWCAKKEMDLVPLGILEGRFPATEGNIRQLS